MAVNRNNYIYGSAVRKVNLEPARDYPKRNSKQQPKQQKKRVAKKSFKSQSLSLNRSYVIFLGVVAIIAVALCVNFLQMKTQLIERSERISALQGELETLKDENDTHYDAIVDSISLEQVKSKALELGMVPANKDQVVRYEDSKSDYVSQYEYIPESGVLAKSERVGVK